jgi:hypothetical protein
VEKRRVVSWKVIATQGENKRRTCFLGGAVGIGLELVVGVLALERLGLEGLLEAVAHHGRACVGV